MARKKYAAQSLNATALWSVEVFGFLIAFYLLLVSARVISAASLPCPTSGIFACTSIIRGKFSYIGPFSIAALGTFYFFAQIALTQFVRAGNWAAWLKGLAIAGGFVFLGWLRATEIVYLHKICPWCYAVCILMLIEAIILWPALTLLPRWGAGFRTATVFGVFLLTSLALCAPAYFMKDAENCYGRQWFPISYSAIDGGTPIEHPDMEHVPTNAAAPKRNAVPIVTPSPTPNVTPNPKLTPVPGAATPAPAVRVTPEPIPVAPGAPAMSFNESSRDNSETKILRERGWRIAANMDSVKSAIKTRGPVLLLAFSPICEECEYLITRQLSSPITEGISITKVAIDQQQLLGDLAVAVDGTPTLMVIDTDGSILWKHKGRVKDANSLVLDVQKAVRK